MDESLLILQAASEFANYPGPVNDTAVEKFLHRYPLPHMILALQTKGNIAGLEDAIVPCLGKIFQTKYGASLIPHYMEFVSEGLKASSLKVRRLACESVICLLEEQKVSALELIAKHGIYSLLLDCLVNSDDQVANSAMEAIIKLAQIPNGTAIVFPDRQEPTSLGNLVSRCSSLGRVRVLCLMVKLFAVSPSLASAVNDSNLIGLMEAEMLKSDDTLIKLNILELFYELAHVPHGTEFLSSVSLLKLFSDVISDASVSSILRSRAVLIIGRLLSNDVIVTTIDSAGVISAILVIDGYLQEQQMNELDSAVGALGLIGSTCKGGNTLLSLTPSPARHVISTAFSQRMELQLIGLHALANICGLMRSEDDVMLDNDAEETLKRLIYEAASNTSKLTPSGLFLSALQRDADARFAMYRVLKNMVFRPWCLMEICSKHDIIDLVTNPTVESTKSGMEERHSCCVSIQNAMQASALMSNPSVAKLSARIQEAVKRGPYLAGNLRQAHPVVDTAERF